MVVYEAGHKNNQVKGAAMQAVLEGLGVFKKFAYDEMKSQGIEELDPNEWYNQQIWLDILKMIYEKVGKNTIFRIGKNIPKNADLPPNIKNVEQAMSSINQAYKMNTKGENVGFYRFEKIDEEESELNRGIMTCNNPYPCEFDHGLIEGFMNRFGDETNFKQKVEHIEGSCRMDGDSVCKYKIIW